LAAKFKYSRQHFGKVLKKKLKILLRKKLIFLIVHLNNELKQKRGVQGFTENLKILMVT
jgi:hypothetical protein